MSRVPRQSRLPLQFFSGSNSSSSSKSKADSFAAANEQAAEIILSDPERAAEGEALPTKWARLFLARHRSPASASCAVFLGGSSEENFLSRHGLHDE